MDKMAKRPVQATDTQFCPPLWAYAYTQKVLFDAVDYIIKIGILADME